MIPSPSFWGLDGIWYPGYYFVFRMAYGTEHTILGIGWHMVCGHNYQPAAKQGSCCHVYLVVDLKTQHMSRLPLQACSKWKADIGQTTLM